MDENLFQIICHSHKVYNKTGEDNHTGRKLNLKRTNCQKRKTWEKINKTQISNTEKKAIKHKRLEEKSINTGTRQKAIQTGKHFEEQNKSKMKS